MGSRCTCYINKISPLPGEVVHRYSGNVYFAICRGCGGDRHASNLTEYLRMRDIQPSGASQAELYAARSGTISSHCPHGHVRSAENTYIRTDGRFTCRVCHRGRENEANKVKREESTCR